MKTAHQLCDQAQTIFVEDLNVTGLARGMLRTDCVTVLHRGLEDIVAQGHRGTETACQVGLSGVADLDRWRGAGMLKSDLGKPALYLLGCWR